MRASQYSISLGTFGLAFAVVLSPALFQTTTYCTPLPPGDTTLSELAVIVGGVEQIAFDASQRSYDVWLPLSADTVLVRAFPTDPSAQVSVALRTGFDLFDAMPFVVGGGEVTIPLEPGTHTLLVNVFPPPNAFGTGIVGQYTVGIQVVCSSSSQCGDGNECTADLCDPNDGICDHTPVDNGTACSLGECLNGVCAGAITVGCAHNVIGDVSIVRFDLQVGPGPIAAGSPFTADLTGVARVPEAFLDSSSLVVPGGVRTFQLIDLAATVSVRSGATGADVVLGADTSALQDLCELTSTPCDPANDVPPDGSQGNTDCIPQGFFNLCQTGFIDIPVIDGIPNSAGGCTQPSPGTPVPDCDCTACEAVDVAGCRPGDPDVPCTKGGQCNENGFCVNGDLPLQLAAQTGNYIAGPSGTPILFGWFDGLGATPVPGLLTLPPAVFNDPTPPVGLRVSVGGLSAALQCLMGVDSSGPNGIATCVDGPNAGLPCIAPANNACDSGTDAGQQCDQSSLTACTFGVPGICVNSDCGSTAGVAHLCSPTDLASVTPDSRLETFVVP